MNGNDLATIGSEENLENPSFLGANPSPTTIFAEAVEETRVYRTDLPHRFGTSFALRTGVSLGAQGQNEILGQDQTQEPGSRQLRKNGELAPVSRRRQVIEGDRRELQKRGGHAAATGPPAGQGASGAKGGQGRGQTDPQASPTPRKAPAWGGDQPTEATVVSGTGCLHPNRRAFRCRRYRCRPGRMANPSTPDPGCASG
jgi:hypothetical protein